MSTETTVVVLLGAAMVGVAAYVVLQRQKQGQAQQPAVQFVQQQPVQLPPPQQTGGVDLGGLLKAGQDLWHGIGNLVVGITGA